MKILQQEIPKNSGYINLYNLIFAVEKNLSINTVACVPQKLTMEMLVKSDGASSTTIWQTCIKVTQCCHSSDHSKSSTLGSSLR
ncbi:unnamed protein product [Parnassius apollo]|uniref:(apollo) hypothetical protein n=1 Tax=Parnassius apollo TaxID=110799 RepID=A0A8S3X3C7_PARAO|nr:unnamed protein product [Parnassius apollo]